MFYWGPVDVLLGTGGCLIGDRWMFYWGPVDLLDVVAGFSPRLRLGWMFDRQVESVPPFAPGAEVVTHLGITEEAQRQICVRRAVGAMAWRTPFLYRPV